MARKIIFNIASKQRRAKPGAATCLADCPLLKDKNSIGVTFKQIGYCPVRAIRLLPDHQVCPYGQSLINRADSIKS